MNKMEKQIEILFNYLGKNGIAFDSNLVSVRIKGFDVHFENQSFRVIDPYGNVEHHYRLAKTVLEKVLENQVEAGGPKIIQTQIRTNCERFVSAHLHA